jgi:16S rRNA (cytidine1402-2'-O)-methyltransferase
MGEFSGGPRIFVVATPIGNLSEMSPRASQVLQSVDLIAAEDTRNARKLLSHLGSTRKEIISYHDHGETEKAEALIQRLMTSGQTLALISDAGTPCVADPGYRLIAAARAAGVPVHPVAGPSALAAMVSVAGLPSDRFAFSGFLPTKASELEKEMARWRILGSAGCSVVCYETPRRLTKSLQVIREHFPLARVAIGRELTKLHEETLLLGIGEACDWANAHESLRGEAVLMVHIPPSSEDVETAPLEDEARAAFASGASLKDLLRRFADRGLPRNELYQLLLRARGEN